MWKNPLPGVPAVESPFFDKIAESECWDEDTLRIGKDLRANGFAILDFPAPEFDALVEEIVRDLAPRYDWDWWKREGWRAREGLRIQDAWEFNAGVRAIAANPRILALLQRLYGRPAFPFQTLNFPVGTQQDVHSDSTHFSSVPERFMCGVWLAFEDTDDGNGALEYYPGSHKLPIYTNEHIGACAATSTNKTAHYRQMITLWQELAAVHGLHKQTFHAKKGQALIWSANLLHGGSGHRDPERTRWSQVTHYYFDDCCYYTPVTSDPFFGAIHYRQLDDIGTGEPRQNYYSGRPVPQKNVEWAMNNLTSHTLTDSLPEDFDPAFYLQTNPDVAAAGMDAAQHWQAFGKHEGRRFKP